MLLQIAKLLPLTHNKQPTNNSTRDNSTRDSSSFINFLKSSNIDEKISSEPFFSRYFKAEEVSDIVSPPAVVASNTPPVVHSVMNFAPPPRPPTHADPPPSTTPTESFWKGEIEGARNGVRFNVVLLPLFSNYQFLHIHLQTHTSWQFEGSMNISKFSNYYEKLILPENRKKREPYSFIVGIGKGLSEKFHAAIPPETATAFAIVVPPYKVKLWIVHTKFPTSLPLIPNVVFGLMEVPFALYQSSGRAPATLSERSIESVFTNSKNELDDPFFSTSSQNEQQHIVISEAGLYHEAKRHKTDETSEERYEERTTHTPQDSWTSRWTNPHAQQETKHSPDRWTHPQQEPRHSPGGPTRSTPQAQQETWRSQMPSYIGASVHRNKPATSSLIIGAPSAGIQPLAHPKRGMCRFFNSSEGCQSGQRCKFVHSCLVCGSEDHCVSFHQ